MNCVARAMRYIYRKLGKSVLLFSIFLVAECTILGTLSILDTSTLINDEIRRQTNSRVMVESTAADEKLTEQDALKISDIDNVNGINRMAKGVAYVYDFSVIAGIDENPIGQVYLIGFDEMEKDSPFTENVCRIVDGEFAKRENEVVINQLLAEYNRIEIGDTISFILDEKSVSAKVTGFYLTGNERKQTDRVSTINRIENQIYTTISFTEKMGIDRYDKIIAYVDNPDLLSETAGTIGNMLGDKVGVSTQDTMYQKMKFSIMQVERITKLIFILTVIASIFVVEILLCMWMRNRKVEIAVFISLGIAKTEIFLQMIIEIIFIYSISSILSAWIFHIFTPFLSATMSSMDFVMVLTFSIWNVWEVWSIGMAILVIITLTAILPFFTKKIRDTLSEMEG